MADVFTQAKRSSVMSRIRSQGNAPIELVAIRLFRNHEIKRWRRRLRNLKDSDAFE
jgi:G:T-mismatch repair DNA endonuclease (very short patch repair protein)